MNGRSDQHPKKREIFLAALELKTPAERAAFLNRACGTDLALREAVEALLQNHQDDAFLESPAVDRPQAAAETATALLEPHPGETLGSRVGRYKLLQQIGEGGVGTVFMAEQEEPVRRRVALKLIKPGMDTKSVIARFESERQALALMDHPNIAKVLDAGATESGRPYFVMELVRGIRVTDYCDENQLTTRERLSLFIKICHAIQHAHQKGIIHRDIKPSNILVTLHDGVPVPMIIDFGIAKATDQRLTDKTFFTEFRAFIGTPAYMSPEQAEMSGLDIDTRTDIYSLGVLLYEFLTGQTPFDAEELLAGGLDEMRRTIRETEPIQPSTRLRTMLDREITTIANRQQSEPGRLASLIRGDLDWIVMKAIEKNRARRYETASALALDVQRHLDNEPVVARPPSTLYRFQKFVRRNKLAFAASTAFAAALIIGLAVATWQFLDKSAAYQRILAAEQQQRLLREEAQNAQATEATLRRQAQIQALAARRRAYAADINLIQLALEVNNLGRAQSLLSLHQPRPGDVDLRGWEWRYLWQSCRSDALFTLCQLSNEVTSLTVSPDGKWVAVTEANRGLSLWDLRGRSEIARLSFGGPPTEVSFSPTVPVLAFSTAEILAGRPEHRVRLWDAPARRALVDLVLTSPCAGLAFSPDGASLITAAADGQITTWRTSNGEKTSTRQGPRMPSFRGRIRFSRDLTLAAVPIDAGQIRVFDLATGSPLWTAKAADEMVTALAFSPDGKTLASGAGFVESTIRLWNVADGAERARLEGHRSWVKDLLFWPDGKTLASASGDQTIRIWDLPSLRTTSTLRGHKLEVWSLALFPDETTLISGSKDGSVYVWDLTTPHRDRGHVTLPIPVRAWRFAPDSQSILTVDAQGRVVRWHGSEFQESAPLFELGISPFGALISPDGTFVTASLTNGVIGVWSVENGSHRINLTPEAGRSVPLTILSDTNHLIARRFPGNTVDRWDLATGALIESWQLPENPAGARGPSRDEGTRPPGPPLEGVPPLQIARPGPGTGLGPWSGIAISPDATWLLSTGDGGRSHLHNLRTHQETPLHLDLKQISQITFSSDGQRFALVSRLGVASLWQTSPLQKIGDLQGFLQGTHSAAFSPDAARLAIGSDGQEAVKLWDALSVHELLTLSGQGSIFNSAAFSPDGNVLAASNSQGMLHLWHAPPLAEIDGKRSPIP